MKCKKCGSTKLMAYNHRDFKSIMYYNSQKWILQSPTTNYIYYNSKYSYYVRCLECHSDVDYQNTFIFDKVYKPKIEHKEIVLDLDGTLFYHNPYWQHEWTKWDIEMKIPDRDRTIKQIKRPYLDQFIKFCCERFEKINFFTSAEQWYAEILIKNLNIPKDKLGFIKTRKDTVRCRPITFEWELIKRLNNSFIIEDNFQVIEGYNNVVYEIKEYISRDPEKDDALLKLIDFIKTHKEEKITFPKKANIKFELFLRNMEINTKDMPIKIMKKIEKEVVSITKEEMIEGKISTNLEAFPYSENSNDGMEFIFADLNYENYLKLFQIIKPYLLDHKKLTEKEFKQVMIDRNQKLNAELDF